MILVKWILILNQLESDIPVKHLVSLDMHFSKQGNALFHNWTESLPVIRSEKKIIEGLVSFVISLYKEAKESDDKNVNYL